MTVFLIKLHYIFLYCVSLRSDFDHTDSGKKYQLHDKCKNCSNSEAKSCVQGLLPRIHQHARTFLSNCRLIDIFVYATFFFCD